MRDVERPPRPFSRRDFLRLGVATFAAFTVPIAFLDHRRLARRSIPIMGTIADFAVAHGRGGERAAQGAIDAAIAELRFVERTMSWFDPESDVGRANRHAARDPVPVSAETGLVVECALGWALASDGAFDPCIGKAMALWNFAERKSPPSAGDIRGLAGRKLYKSLDLGERGATPVVLYGSPDVSLDLGGIAKGYGVDRAVAALRANGIADALVNVGGDLYAMGRSENGDPWKIGVRDSKDPDAIIAVVEAADRAVATSGDYIRCFDYDGRRYHHLLDPLTGAPRVARMHSVTVAADDCMTADAAATAAFGMARDRAASLFARRAPSAEIIHSV